MTRALAAASLGIVLTIALVWALRPASPPPPPATPAPSETAAVATTTQTYSTTPVSVQLEGDAELAAAVDGFLSAVPVSPTGPTSGKSAAEVWKESQANGDGPLDFGLALDQSIRARGPRGAARLLLEDMNEADDRFLFVAAKTLAGRLDRPAALDLLRGLPDADPRVRSQVVFALRGSPDPEVDEAFVDLYLGDKDPAVRARAGSNLADRLERLEPPLRDRALGHAREQIHAEDREQFEAAADVLGGAPLNERDRSSLEAMVTTGVDPTRRMAALRALATSGLSPGDLQGVLAQVRDDPSAGDELHALARQLLGQ